MADLTVRCDCGSLTGVLRDVAPENGNHVACYCRDCQAFARHLGKADAVLDAHGGSHIFQVVSTTLDITRGKDQLACLRLSPKGLLRWYARCCNTPLGNTLATPALPFVGMIVNVLHDGKDGAQLKAALGPVRTYAYTKFAPGAPPQSGMFKLITRFARMMLVARLRGEHKRSPLFPGGKPASIPHVLSEAERASAYGPGDRL